MRELQRICAITAADLEGVVALGLEALRVLHVEPEAFAGDRNRRVAVDVVERGGEIVGDHWLAFTTSGQKTWSSQTMEVAPTLSATRPMIVTQTIHFFSRTLPRKPTGPWPSSSMLFPLPLTQ